MISHCGGFSWCRAQVLQCTGSVVWHTGLVALGHMGFSQIRDWTCVACAGRWILYHWTTRETLKVLFISPLLLLSRFSRVRLCATPWTAAHQAPPSLGFSRQEHWSGLLFPSPVHESEKWKRSQLLNRVPLLATPWTAAYQAPPSMGFARQEYWSGVLLPSLNLSYICSYPSLS